MRVMVLLLLLTGCASAVPDAGSPRADSRPRRFGGPGEPLRYLVLGDSTTVAVGGDYEQGLAVESARHLAASRPVELVNAGVSGARMRDVLVEQLPRVDLARVDVVLIVAGSNDVIRLTRSRSFERDLDEIITRIARSSPRAAIVLTGAADMGSPPRIPRLLRPLATFRTRRLNAIVRRSAARHDLTFAPIAERTGPAFRRDRSLFSDDRFHPNDRGYALWTAVIIEALENATRMVTMRS